MSDINALNRENYNKLAPLYDTYLNLAFDMETNWYIEVEKRFQEMGLSNNKVIDIGCGTGTFGIFLGNIGYDVVGVDNSPNMLIVARNKLRLFNTNRENTRDTLLNHAYLSVNPNAKVVFSKIKPRVRFIEGDIVNKSGVVSEMFGTATLFDALHCIPSDDLDKLFANVSSILFPGGIFCMLYFTGLHLETGIGSSDVEKEHIDYHIDSKWADESHKIINRKLHFKAVKSLPTEVDIELTEFNHSLRDIVSLYHKHGFQIQKMICDSHINSESDSEIDVICDAVEKSCEMPTGVRKVLIFGRKTA